MSWEWKGISEESVYKWGGIKYLAFFSQLALEESGKQAFGCERGKPKQPDTRKAADMLGSQ